METERTQIYDKSDKLISHANKIMKRYNISARFFSDEKTIREAQKLIYDGLVVETPSYKNSGIIGYDAKLKVQIVSNGKDSYVLDETDNISVFHGIFHYETIVGCGRIFLKKNGKKLFTELIYKGPLLELIDENTGEFGKLVIRKEFRGTFNFYYIFLIAFDYVLKNKLNLLGRSENPRVIYFFKDLLKFEWDEVNGMYFFHGSNDKVKESLQLTKDLLQQKLKKANF
jgi:hypothetical protein